jgi:hypothetical protein
MVVVFGGRFENITAQTTLSGDNLTWGQNTRNDSTLGLDAGAVTQRGENQSGVDQTITAKTITTTGTTQAGAGIMFVIEQQPPINDSISEPTSATDASNSAIVPNYLLSTTQGINGTAGTTLSVTLPSGIQKGETIALFIASPVGVTAPSGWTNPFLNSITGTSGGVNYRQYIWKAQGWEGGKVINFTLSSSAKASYFCLRISDQATLVLSERNSGLAATSITFSNAVSGNETNVLDVYGLTMTPNNVVPSTFSTGHALLAQQLGDAAAGASIWIQRRSNRVSLPAFSADALSAVTIASSDYFSLTFSIQPKPAGVSVVAGDPNYAATSSFNADISTGAGNVSIGFGFKGTDCVATRIDLFLSRGSSTTTTTLRLRIYEATGIYPSITPIGSFIAESTNTESGANLGASATFAAIGFNFAGVKLVGGRSYVAMLEGSSIDSNSVYLGRAGSSNYGSGVITTNNTSYTSTSTTPAYLIYSNNFGAYDHRHQDWMESSKSSVLAARPSGFTYYYNDFIANHSWAGSSPSSFWEAVFEIDPAGSGRRALRMRTLDPNGDAERAQWSIEYKDWHSQSIYHTRHRVFFNNDLAFLNQYTGSIAEVGEYLTLFEIWNNTGIGTVFSDGDIGGSARWSFGLYKTAGAGSTLRFKLTGEKMQPLADLETDLWGTGEVINSTVNAANWFGKWITIDVYMKRGSGSAGKLRITFIDEDTGQATVIHDVNNHTLYPTQTQLNLRYWQPFKLYVGQGLFDFASANSKKIEGWYSDFVVYDDNNGTLAIDEYEKATDSVNNDVGASIITEAAGQDETINAQRALAVSASETAGISETTNATQQTSRSVTETATATESVNGVKVQLVSISESTGQAETTNAQRTLAVSASESAGLPETTNATQQTSRSLTEVAGLPETTNGTQQTSRGVTEAASASEVADGNTAQLQSVIENAGQAETISATQQTSRSTTETAGQPEAVSSTIQSSRSVTEAAGLPETINRSIIATGGVTEPTSATEAANRTATLVSAIAEVISATESVNRTAVYVVSVSENTPAVEFVTEQGANVILELTSANSAEGASVIRYAIRVESTSPTDLVGATAVKFVGAAENAVAAEVINSTALKGGSIAEPVNAVDVTDSSTAYLFMVSITEAANANTVSALGGIFRYGAFGIHAVGGNKISGKRVVSGNIVQSSHKISENRAAFNYSVSPNVRNGQHKINT